MKENRSYLQQMARQLQGLDDDLDKLKAKAEKAKTGNTAAVQRQIDEVQAKKHTLDEEIKQLQEAGDESWDDVKMGMEKSWQEVMDTFSKISSNLN